MKNLYVNSIFLDTLPTLGNGAHGICYKYDNLVLKKMYDVSGITCPYGIKNNSYLMPKQPLYIDGIYQGLVMDYYHGEDLTIVDSEYTFEDFYKHLDKFIKDTKTLSKSHIFVEDLYRYNILFNLNNGYKVCDTQEYYQNKNTSYKETCDHNIKALNSGIYNSIFKTNDAFTREFLRKYSKYKIIGNSEKFSYEFIEDLYNFACNYNKRDINNIGEYKKLVVRR